MRAKTSTERRLATRTAHRLASIVIAAAGLAATRPAHAQQAPPSLPEAPPSFPQAQVTRPPEAPAPPPTGPKRWYGWKILLADILPLAAITAGGIDLARSNSSVGAVFLTAGFFSSHFSGPIVHAVHRRKGDDSGLIFGADYGMRALLPAFTLLAGFGIGMKLHCVPRDGCLTGVIGGMIAGSHIASIIDAVAIAWEAEPAKPRALRLTPGLTPVHGGFVGGLSGRF